MKLKQYLKESTLYVETKNLPDWAKNILKKEGIRKPVSTKAGITHNIGHNWHDSNCMDIILWKDNKIKSVSYCGGPAINDRPDILQWKNGVDVSLKNGEMIMVISSYPKGASLYVHPDDIKPLLDAPTTSSDMTPGEIFSLYITRSLKSAARKHSAAAVNVDYDGCVKLLKSKNLVSNGGGITTQGKNFLSSYFQSLGMREYTSEWEVAKKLGLA